MPRQGALTQSESAELTVNELVEAEKLWIKDAQAELETDVKYAQLSNSQGGDRRMAF